MDIVSNTGPLIALAKIDQLGLLEKLFGKIFIPTTVQRELLAKVGPEAARLDQALATFVTVKAPDEAKPEVQAATRYLDEGERQVIMLAHELNLLLLIDDRLGRQAA